MPPIEIPLPARMAPTFPLRGWCPGAQILPHQGRGSPPAGLEDPWSLDCRRISYSWTAREGRAERCPPRRMPPGALHRKFVPIECGGAGGWSDGPGPLPPPVVGEGSASRDGPGRVSPMMWASCGPELLPGDTENLSADPRVKCLLRHTSSHRHSQAQKTLDICATLRYAAHRGGPRPWRRHGRRTRRRSGRRCTCE